MEAMVEDQSQVDSPWAIRNDRIILRVTKPTSSPSEHYIDLTKFMRGIDSSRTPHNSEYLDGRRLDFQAIEKEVDLALGFDYPSERFFWRGYLCPGMPESDMFITQGNFVDRRTRWVHR